MCGLFGIASTYLNAEEVKVFQQLGIVSQLRGLDSTGVMGAYKKPVEGEKNKFSGHKYIYHKKAVPSSQLLFAEQKYWDLPEAVLLAGHTRLATAGAVNDRLSHPFAFDHLCGMHNGTVARYRPSKSEEEEWSDSRKVYQRMSEVGWEKTVEECAYGSFALVWLDTKEGTLNFIRNAERTLFYMKSKNGGTIVWASEASFLRFVDARTSIIWDEIKPFEEYKKYTLKVGTRPDLEVTDVKRPFRSWEGWEGGSYTPRQGSYGDWYQRSQTHYRNTSAAIPEGRRLLPATTTTDEQKEKKGEEKISPLQSEVGDTLDGIFDEVFASCLSSHALDLDAPQLGELVKDIISSALSKGCSWCLTEPEITDHAYLAGCAWVDQNTFICADCLKSKEARQNLSAMHTPRTLYIHDEGVRGRIFNSSN